MSKLNDKEIREFLFMDTLKVYCDSSDTAVIEEFPICCGEVRADIAIVNGSLHAYEIKSDFDTLVRIGKQVNKYSLVFDYITIVAGPKQTDKVLEMVPAYCGVLTIRHQCDEIVVTEIRKAQKNIYNVSFSLAQLLWKEEALSLLSTIALDKKYKNARRWLIWEAIASHFSTDEVSAFVRNKIKQRTPKLPNSLLF